MTYEMLDGSEIPKFVPARSAIVGTRSRFPTIM
jgi:hypothetical protein